MSFYRILVVDDDDDLRDLLLMTMRPNFEVVLAVDGLDALKHLSAYQPDLAILDLDLPLMNGFELCTAIRNHPDFRDIPVLFLSGQGSTDNIKKGYAAGANLFMVKPIDAARILKNVEMTIQQKRPLLRPKRFTLEQLREFEAAGTLPVAGPSPSPETPAPAQSPAQPTSYRQERAHVAAAQPPPGNEPEPVARVMVVDDDDDMRQLMDLSLNQDFEVTLARDGLEAVRKIVDYQPDVVLLDVMMPGMNGFHLLQSIRRNPSLHDLPIVIVSARASQRDRDHAAQLGANGFIAKPFRPEELVEYLRKMTKSPDFKIHPKRRTIEEIIDLEFCEVNGRQELLVLKGVHRRKYLSAQEILADKARKKRQPPP